MHRLLAALLATLVLFAAGTRAHADESEATDGEALARDAEAARAAGLFEQCIQKDTASVAARPSPTTRAHLAGCADSVGKVLLALEQLRVVLDEAIAAQNANLADAARMRVEQLLRRLGGLTIDPPPNATSLVITIDDVVVTPEQYKKTLAVDPGPHRIHAEGELDGTASAFDEVKTLADGERATVSVVLVPRAAEHLTPGQLACMQAAKSDDEAFKCLPGKNKPLIGRVALEMSAYADTFSVLILNPLVRASIASPTKGWSIGASYLVDVISAASPDFVSTASPRGHDTRHAVAANGAYKPGRYGVEAGGSFSTEADYVSRSGALAVNADLLDKRVTPRLAWNIAYDTIGRGGTPFDFFSHELLTNEGAASTSIILSPRSLLIVGVTGGFERGDQSKPYRLIPMFAPGVTVAQGATADEVNAKRLPVRPYEQLPLQRDRWALAARLIRRFGRSSTLRLDERLYTDTWQNRATTTDVRLLVDTSPTFTVGPHARFNAQTGTSFFHRVYNAYVGPTGPVTVPSFRTTDRELGPLYSFTLGASAVWKLSQEDAGIGWLVYGSGDALYSIYTNSLYVTSRIAPYGTLGIEAVFE
jgi:hypothetical protein